MLPETYDDFIGNKQAVDKVKLLTADAEGNNILRIPDLAFFGPSGHGKNALARILAKRLGRKLIEINSTAVKDPFQFRGYIINGDFNATGAIIHLDECHQLTRKIQDNLLSVTESPRELHTSYKDQVFQDKLQENISFIFSTTHSGNLRKALLTRLEAIEFGEYSAADQLTLAINYLSKGHNMTKDTIEPGALVEIANRARNPRQVRKFCDNAMRYMKQNGVTVLTKSVMEKCFDVLGVDSHGLTRCDKRILSYLAKVDNFVGLDTLEALTNTSKNEIRDNVEPYLLRRGYMQRHSAGRIITVKGKQAIKETS